MSNTGTALDGYLVVKANDESSADAEKFAVKETAQLIHYREAVVTRSGGLRLLDKENKRCLYFSNALCGYVGDGPRATANILELAGYGYRFKILDAIANHHLVVLRRVKTADLKPAFKILERM